MGGAGWDEDDAAGGERVGSAGDDEGGATGETDIETVVGGRCQGDGSERRTAAWTVQEMLVKRSASSIGDAVSAMARVCCRGTG